MGKPASQRQRQYLARLKEKNNGEYLKKERERKNKRLIDLKSKENNSKAYKEHLKKDRERKLLARQQKRKESSASTPSPGSPKQVLHRSVNKVNRALPKSSPLKVKVLSALVNNLSLSKKQRVFSNARRALQVGKGRESKLNNNRKYIVSFLEQPDISYCKPGRRDTAYCGKSVDGQKVYRSKHYLLYNIQELTSLYNEDHKDNTITYHQIREVISSENHLVNQNKTPEDDCRCETCENGELFLEAIRQHFHKVKHASIVENLPVDPLQLVELSVCSIKSSSYITGQCKECPGAAVVENICEELEKLDFLTYYRWNTENKNVRKVSEKLSGGDAASKLIEMTSGDKLKLHNYNIYRQYSELKWLKKNLNENEVILSVDFSKNYQTSSGMKFRVPILGTRILPYLLLLVTFMEVCLSKMEN